MAGIFDAISNGIVNAGVATKNLYEDFRSPNRYSPRTPVEDPTRTIDDEDTPAIISFPHDRAKYYMSFGFEEYRRPTQFEGLKSKGIIDYICLPIPTNLRDNSSFNYGDLSGSFVIEAATRSWQDSAESMKANGKMNMEGLIESLDAGTMVKAGEVVTGGAVRSGVDSLRKGFDVLGSPRFIDTALQLPGLADNPFTTVAFGGPNFKTHSFSWRFSPKSEAESITIKEIIQTFKKVAHPDLLSAGAGGFYKYPWIVWPKFNPTEAADYMYKFKPCVITDIIIDYSPHQSPGFYAISNAPIEIIFSIHLKEIEIWRNGSDVNLQEGGIPTASGGDFDGVSYPPVQDLGNID